MTAREASGGLIVVGVDGSDSSVDALRWAAAQAKLTNSALEVMATWAYPASYGWAPAWPEDWDPQKETERALTDVVEGAIGSSPGIQVRQLVVEGHAAQVLVKASRDADLLVVGSRGHGAFTGMLLGSVSEYLATHCLCPVVIMHRKHDDQGGHGGGSQHRTDKSSSGGGASR
jgi:nucleotide-binding universal stress UspA family protein